MIVQELVDSTIKRLYPKEYLPCSTGVVRAVICVSPQELKDMALAYGATLDESGHSSLRAVTLRVGMVINSLSTDPEIKARWDGAHYILVSEDIESAEELAFALTHELGHVHWCTENILEQGKFSEEDEEVYCDLYAFERISDVLGMDKAVTILATVGITKNGLMDK